MASQSKDTPPEQSIDLKNLSKEELIFRIQTLERHNTQLRNIIAKPQEPKIKQQTKKRPFDFTRWEFRHILLKFYYLGWNYQGYVVQEDNTNTIEHHIFEALLKTCLIRDRASSNYHRCGRTDKGVSSFAQVISIDLRSKTNKPEEEFDYCKMLNRVLPSDIQFVAWCYADTNFSARFDCKGRTYKYFFPRGDLNIDRMKSAADYLVGTHDFRNFCKMDVNNGVTVFIRNISYVDISRFDDKDNDEYAIYIFTIKGTAFLWHQIRCIITVLFLIGQENENPDVILELLDVNKNPRKPDYNLANEIPLNLYETDFGNTEWRYSKEGLEVAFKKLQETWTFLNIKSTMIKSMLQDLSINLQKEETCVSDCLIKGVKTKTYVPLMKRPLCDSLEDKLSHVKKKAKMKRTPQD